jgi:adenylate cyclase, class 2
MYISKKAATSHHEVAAFFTLLSAESPPPGRRREQTGMNGQEIEAKFHVKDLAKIGARLRELKAELIQPRVHETNLRFDTPDGKLRREGRVLRLRQDDQARMTYKGPSDKSNGVMSREEIEFVVEDFERAKQFIEALGYETTVFYEKYRTTFELHAAHIMLDELPYGDFVEIEGSDVESIRRIADKLGLRWDAAIATSYQALFERVAKSRGLAQDRLAFEVFGSDRPAAKELGVVQAD